MRHAALALMMLVIILGGIYGGVFTPTEASAVSVMYALTVGIFLYREINYANFMKALQRSVVSTSIIMFIIACARSEEHTSELQSLMRISYAVCCLKKKTKKYSQ